MGTSMRNNNEDNRSTVHESQEMFKFMGEMRASLEHRGEVMDELKDQLEEMKRSQLETNKKVDGLLEKITKWEAKLGAFMFIATCLWAFFMGMKEQILAFVKG